MGISWEYHGNIMVYDGDTVGYPLITDIYNYGKSPFSMGKSIINGNFQ